MLNGLADGDTAAAGDREVEGDLEALTDDVDAGEGGAGDLEVEGAVEALTDEDDEDDADDDDVADVEFWAAAKVAPSSKTILMQEVMTGPVCAPCFFAKTYVANGKKGREPSA